MVKNVVAVPLEQLVRRHPDTHVEVAGASSSLPRSSLARHPDALALIDAGGYLHRHSALGRTTAGAPALGAGLLDDLPGPRTPQTHPGLDELSEHGAADDPHLAATVALRAGLDRGNIHRARTFTGGADSLRGERDLLLDAEGRLLERQLHIDGKIVPAGGPSLLSRPEGTAAERPAEQILEKVAKAREAVEVEAAGAAGAAAQAIVPVRVVGATLLRIAEHLVRFGGFLELVLAVGIVNSHVGVVLASQLAIGLLYLLDIGVTGDAEHFVVVALHRSGVIRTALPPAPTATAPSRAPWRWPSRSPCGWGRPG